MLDVPAATHIGSTRSLEVVSYLSINTLGYGEKWSVRSRNVEIKRSEEEATDYRIRVDIKFTWNYWRIYPMSYYKVIDPTMVAHITTDYFTALIENAVSVFIGCAATDRGDF
jgi:hypothetical protein